MQATYPSASVVAYTPPSNNTTPSPPTTPFMLRTALPFTLRTPPASATAVEAPPLLSSAACDIRCDQCDLSLAQDFPTCFLRKMVGAKRGREEDDDGDDVGARLGLLSGRGTKRVEIEVEADGGGRVAVPVGRGVETDVAAAAAAAGHFGVGTFGTLSLLKAVAAAGGGGRGDREAYWPSELCW